MAAGTRTEKPAGSSSAALRCRCPLLLTSSLSVQPHQLHTRALQFAPVQPSAASLTAPTPRVGKLTFSLSVKALTSLIAAVRPTMACLVMLHPNTYYLGPSKHSYYHPSPTYTTFLRCQLGCSFNSAFVIRTDTPALSTLKDPFMASR